MNKKMIISNRGSTAGVLPWLAFCLSIAGVNAATFVVNSTLDRGDANPGNGICASSDGSCTLRAAIQEANMLPGADIIQLPAGTYALQIADLGIEILPGMTDLSESGDFDITGPVTIVGAGAGLTILDGGAPPLGVAPEVRGMDRLFQIHRGAGDVSISSVTLREGYNQESGGAILFGAPAEQDPFGVPLSPSEGTLRLENVHVLNCYSGDYGGGINNAGRGRVELIGVVMSGNGAQAGGTAINNAGAGTVAILSNSSITNNPGAVIPDPTDPGGFILANPLDYPLGPGAIHNQGVEGAVGTIHVADSTVSGNAAEAGGAGIYNEGEGNVIVERSTLNGNITEASGAAIYHNSGLLTVTDSTLSHNKAADGGAIANNGGVSAAGLRARATLTRAIVSHNHAHASGGGIWNAGDGEMILNDSSVSNNFAGDAGGGINSAGQTALEITDGIFTHNQSVGVGGAVNSEGERATRIVNTIFAHNLSGAIPLIEIEFNEFGQPLPGEGGGGGFHSDGGGAIEIIDCLFEHNFCNGDGGAIALHGFGAVSVTDTMIRNNEAHGEEEEGNGGGVENSAGRVIFTRVTISHNEAFTDGGGVNNTSSGEFLIFDCTFDHNIAANGGGLANLSDSTLEVRGTLFYANTARHNPAHEHSGHGGGIYSMSDGHSWVENNTISFNVAHSRGGGLYHEADGNLEVSHTTIWRNAAPMGGGIAILETDSPEPKVPPDTNTAIVVFNSIVGGSLQGGSCDAAIKSYGGNIDTGSTCYFVGIRDLWNTDPELDAIADNGGPTMTHALRGNSPAIDHAVGVSPLVDQRGVSRPLNGKSDSGAYEYEGPFLPPDMQDPETFFLTRQTDDVTGEAWVFTFDSSDNRTPPHQMSYECRLLIFDPTEPPEPIVPTEPLDPELAFVPCQSPHLFPAQEEGHYQFEVRAIDHAGNTDDSPAVHIFTIAPPSIGPVTILTEFPPNPSGRNATFSFLGFDSETPPNLFEYECRLDSNDPEHWLECMNPMVYSDLTVGTHTFQVRALGLAEIVGAPATYTWTVGLPNNCDEANVTLTASADVSVDQLDPLANFMFEPELTVRTGVGENAHALFRFPIINDAPSCTLESATLRLYSGSGTEGRTLQAALIASAWSENTVTWSGRPGTLTSPAPATTTSGEAYREWNVTEHARQILAGTIPNHGWLIRDAIPNDPEGADQSFASRELEFDLPDVTLPQLVLRYEAAPPTPLPAQGTPQPTFAFCGQVLTESTLLLGDVIGCTGEGLVIGAPNIILDLNGFTVGSGLIVEPGEEDGLNIGIRNSGHANVTIRNGSVTNFGYGVRLMGGAKFNVVEGMTLENNIIAGVELYDADDGRNGNTIRFNHFQGNGEGAIGLVAGTENSLVISNTFFGNGGKGVFLQDASRNRIEANQISGLTFNPLIDSDGGMELVRSSDNIIINNVVSDSGDAGIQIHMGSHRNHIQGNTFFRTSDSGISVDDSDGNVVINNVAHQTGGSGISLGNAHGTLIRGNDVRFNPGGIELGNSDNVMVEGNDANYSLADGISIEGGLNIQVISNNASFGRATGISVQSDAFDALGNPILGAIVRGNKANQNLGDGISIGAGGHRVGDNEAHHNAGFGIIADEFVVDLGGNTASGNAEPEQCFGVACGPGSVPLAAPDLTAPETFFITTPPLVTSSPTSIFTFGATDNLVPLTALIFECRLDPGPDPVIVPEPPEPPEPGEPPEPPDTVDTPGWTECFSPLNVGLLLGGETMITILPGQHTLQVRAIDPFDNVDLTPVSYTWMIEPLPEFEGPDSMPPNTTIASGPSGNVESTIATFTFRGSDNATPGFNLTYRCRLDDAAFAPCTSPITYTGLDGGTHTFQVAAVDSHGNVDLSPATRTWTVVGIPTEQDGSPPETTIVSTPHGATVLTSATFVFSSSETGSTFACSLDGAPFTACTSPVSYTGLAVSTHTFSVQATDAAGNTDPTPAVFSWNVGPAPVPTTVACGQVIMQSIRVMNDLFECPGMGLIVGAPEITIDLNSKTIDGIGNGVGIHNPGFDLVTIQNGTIKEFDAGVALMDGTALNILQGLVVTLNQEVGIALLNADNGPTGIAINGISGNIIRDSQVVDNDMGILVGSGTQSTLIADNVIGASDGDGVLVELSSGARVERNQIASSSGAAVMLAGASGNIVRSNTAFDNDGGGVVMEAIPAKDSEAEKLRLLLVVPIIDPFTGEPIELPELPDPPAQGDFPVAANDNLVENNSIEAGNIRITASSGNQVIGNHVRSGGGSGIVMEFAQNSLILSNNVDLNSTGIEMKTSSGNRLEGNSASDNDGTGISLQSLSLNNVLVGNIASFNDAAGIYIGDVAAAGQGNVLEGNIANNNNGNGIHVSGTGHFIIGNVANDNGAYGIYSTLGTMASSNIDGGGNRALGNVGHVDQYLGQIECFNIVCDGSTLIITDLVPPQTLIISGPSITVDTTATFRFIGSDNAGTVRFQCRLDSSNEADFVPCTSPRTYTGLLPGGHTLQVRAVDSVGNVDATPASHSWTIAALPANMPPETTIVSGPDHTTASTTAAFVFSANMADATFECSLDGGDFLPCSSPATQTGIGVGPHTYAVRAVRFNGTDVLADATPATWSWTVTAAPIPTFVSCGEFLMQSTLVMNDLLDCPGHALVIGANGITIDLNGHIIDGTGAEAGVLNPGYHSVSIINGTVREFDFGVQLNPRSLNNIVSGLALEANQEAAVLLSDADGALVHNNTLTGNGAGIWLTSATRDATIRGNTLIGNTGEGILLEFSSANEIEGNTFTANSGAAITLIGSHQNTIANNIMAETLGAAILVGDGIALPSHNNLISGNTIAGGLTGGGAGIVIAGGNGNQVLDNTVQASNGGAIALEEASNTLVRGNLLRGSKSGIEVGDSWGSLIEFNDASGTLGTGIDVEGFSTNNIIADNFANMNAGDGISISDVAPPGHANQVLNNFVSANGGDGIAVHGTGHIITGNAAEYNAGWGIYAVLGNTDGGGNSAVGNVEPGECLNIACTIGAAPGAPETWLVEFPPLISNSRFATFIFNGSSLTTPLFNLIFECRLDSTDPLAFSESECENPMYFAGLSPGTHVFEVRAVDLNGLADPTPAIHIWTYVPAPANVAPDTLIDLNPGTETWLLENIFTFHATEPDVVFECQLDGGSWLPCSFETEVVPFSFGAFVAEWEEFQIGTHTFAVRAIDFDGNVDPTPATFTWTVLGVLAVVTSGPGIQFGEPGEPASGGETLSSSAFFEFHGTVAGSTFMCSLDLAPFVPCTSPQVLTGLTIGEHLLRIYAIDPNGFEQEEPTEYEWEVVPPVTDTTAPETFLTLAPVSGTAQIMFEFHGTDNVTPAELLLFECRLDSVNPLDWVECISPFNLHDLIAPELFFPGTHTFEVRAVDDAEPLDPNAPQEGNPDPTPVVYTWTSIADTVAPNTTIMLGPPLLTLVDAEVEIHFTGTDNSTPPPNLDPNLPSSDFVLVFECNLDTNSADGVTLLWEPCESPVNVSGLLPGLHELRVRAIDLSLNVDLTPALYTWTVVGPPIVTITAGPTAGSIVASTTATISFVADQSPVTFQCQLGDLGFVPCTSPVTYNHLPNMGLTFSVQAINIYGMVSEEPATVQWTVNGPADIAGPETVILTGPPSPTHASVSIFTFTSNEPFVEFECSLDGGVTFNGCETPYETPDLLSGEHTLLVRAVDFAGNIDASPASYTWTADLPPEVTILTSPLDVTDSTTALFEFIANEPNVTFICWMDGVTNACTSPVTYTGLSIGEHVFAVLAIDSAGQTAVAWEDHEFIVDYPPDTIILVGPTSNTSEYLFAFTGTDTPTFAFPTTQLTFECSLDGAPFVDCENPYSLLNLVLGGQLAAGSHTLQVRAVDEGELADPTPAVHTWTFGSDTTAPETLINLGPLAMTTEPSAMFAFSSSEAPETFAFFECSLDNAEFSQCTSPSTFSGLAVGWHTLRVRAVDVFGNADQTPAGYIWQVTAVPPETSINSVPVSSSTNTTATFVFSSSEPGSTFECSLDSEAFTACSSPLGLTGLSLGAHTFAVRATGLAGTTDATPATYTWTVEALPPPNCGPVITIIADHDAWLEQSDPNKNTGTDSDLMVRSKGPNQNSRTVVRFPLPLQPDRCTVLSATLHLFATSGQAGRTLQAVRLASTWSEDTITWGNQPATTGTAATTASGTGYLQWNVTSQVQAMISSGQPFGFVIKDAAENDPSNSWEQKFYSKEKGAGMPELVITFAPAPAADTIAPVTVIETRPDAITAATGASFTFSSTEVGGTFQCSLDGSAFAPCASPASYSGLALGNHLFRVRAIDAAGNADPTPASHDWSIVDALSLIDTAILLGPEILTASTDASFEFTGVDNTTPTLDLQFQCSLDGTPFAPCSSPASYSGLGLGVHTFMVRAVDLDSNVDQTPATYTWTVDTSDNIPPDTTIIAGPPAISGLVEVGFAFIGTDNVTPMLEMSFECSLNGEPFASCDSPLILEGMEPTPLGEPPLPPEPGMVRFGPNRLEVRAIDGDGQVDPTPAVYEWTYVEPPVTIFTSGPGTFTPPAAAGEPYTGGISGSTSATFTFEANQPGVSFLCTIEALIMFPCSSPFTINGLLDGEQYELEVYATNMFVGSIEVEPAVYEWEVLLPTDTSPPNTTILTGPSGFNASSYAVFTFTGSDGRTIASELDFMCWLDGVNLGGCSSPFEVEVEGEFGSHTFQVAAIDEQGLVDPTPATRTWTLVDLTAPDTSIDSGPESVELGEPVPPDQQNGTATFTFSGIEEITGLPVFDFECSLDGADFVPCTSPYTITGVGSGGHVLMVRAVDASGNPDPTPDFWDWIIEGAVDMTPPDTFILGIQIVQPFPGSGDPVLTTISFTASEAGVEFECSLDGGAFEGCEVPYELEGLAPGNHTIAVRAIDLFGNVDATPATQSFVIGDAPETTIVSGPPAVTGESTATFIFTSSEPGSTFLCSVDGGEFTGCTSPWLVQIIEVEEETHTFEVQAISPLGLIDQTPASYTWTIGLPPDTEILSVIYLDITDLVEPNSLQVTYVGSDDRTPLLELEFECSLDGGPFEGCDFPHYVSFDELPAGDHVLAIRAVDGGGNVDPTPATYSWSTAPTPETTIVSGPAAETDSTSATFTFASDQASVVFECSLDLAPYAPCPATLNLTGLALGEHLLSVRAVSTASTINNVDLTPTEYEWLVGTMVAPQVSFSAGPGAFPTPTPPLGEPYLGGETSATTATFAFGVDVNIEGFVLLCSLNGSPLAPCTSPVIFTEAQLALATGTAIGDHTFEIEAFHPFLIGEATNAVYEWTIVDIAPPNTTITLAPPALMGSTTAIFEFTGTDNGTLPLALDFECSLDGGAFEPCSSPHEIIDLPTGSRTFAVRAVDEALLVDPSPATHSWTVNPGLVFCGQLLTNSIAIGNDLLDCPGNGLIIGAAGITVDLNGHTIAGLGLVGGVWTEGVGILNEGFDMVTITNSLATGGVRQFQTGVQIGSVVSNTVASLNVQANQVGISLAGAGDGVDSNTVVSNRVAGNEIGILLAGGTELALVYGNTVENNSDQGIRVESSSGNRLEANEVTASPGANVVLADGADANTVIANTLTGSAGYGLVIMEGSEANRIEANMVNNNGGGIGIFNSVTNEVVGNSIQQNAAAGMALVDAHDHVITGNDLRFNGAGIDLLGSTGNWLQGNNASQSTGNGISLGNDAQAQPSIANTLLLNTASGNGANGIVISSEAPIATPPDFLGNVLDQNTASGNVLDGILVTAAGHGLVANTANNNGRWGIFAAQGTVDAGDNVAAGNVQAQQCFGIVCNGSGANDVTPPDTVILTAPANPTTSASATFTFTASEQVQLFECALDGVAIVPCVSPVTLQDLAGGSYTFQAWSTDMAGNVETTPASHTWTIHLPPETTIVSGPDEITSSTSASIVFTSSDAGATFECRYAAAPTVIETVAFAPCTSPFNLSGLGQGEHEFEVRSTSAFGLPDLSPADHSWEVDTIVPETTLATSGPSGSTTNTSATFTFSSTEADVMFLCSLDGAPWSPCVSPVTYSSLSVATHVFGVTAVDLAGNADQTPATRTWSVTAAALPPVAPSTVTANADAWIDQNSAANNNGSDSILKVQAKGGNNMRALVRFPLPNIPAGYVVQSATLRLYAASSRTGRTLQALRINASWAESTVRWNNQPATTGTAATTTSGTGYRQWNVTAHVLQMYSSGNNGFLIRDASDSGGGFEQQFHSREKGENIPELIINWAPAP